MARRSQCSDAGDNPLDPNYLPPHYREEYRLAIDALVEEDIDGYYKFLQFVDVVDFLSASEINYIQKFIQLPKQSSHPEQRYLDSGVDGSSDTYWPLHSDLDAPGLDLGWPQLHHFIGPTEVTTLVNPAAPDMPSIKEQARRLIKNAQMVIAVVMDMFTDVDIFADILNAAMRNVAVYLLLDEANVDHFINMVNNCRVNLQSLQYLRVRTVSGIRYHCRSGKSFKGQMLDRFILTDCRAVLSGNYSFMWSYEKLHRCMAHLFLGQLVSTFDEEFRILFAQSEPLIIENVEDMTVLSKRPLPGERPPHRDVRKYRMMDTGPQEEWNRQPYEENMDWRTMPFKRPDTFHGPMDIYNRYPSPQSRLEPQTRLEPQFDQGPPRMMDSLINKRHSFVEGPGPGRYNPPYQQQGLPEVEQPGRPYYRGQQHLHPRGEPDFGGYGQMEKFWNQDFQQEENYPEPGYSQDIESHEDYDPVLNYLSSTRNVEMDQSSDKLIPGPDLPYSTTHPRRHNISQTYACQTSPTPSNTTEKKFMQEHSSDRKDPTVKRGLRNWRISSYLSAYDGSGEQEGLPMGQGQTMDPFEDTPHPSQQPTPPPPDVVELAVSKIPNVREFKVPALPRVSQMQAFAKMTPRDLPKKFPDEIPQVPPPVLFVPEPKVITPTPSESSSTTDGEKQEEPEPREPITSTLRREESFRRKYNAPAVQRSSRLRSSLIFSKLEQNANQDNTEQEDDKTKTDTEITKLPFVSQVLAQRRSGAREPFEWRNYIKSTDNAKMEEDGGKQVEKDTESKLETVKESQDGAKADLASKVDEALPKTLQTEQPKTEQHPPAPMENPTKSLSFVDMNDPDQRFLFFKELAAQRRAAKATEESKLKHETPTKDKKNEEKKEEKTQKDFVGAITKSNEDSKKVDAKNDSDGKLDIDIGDRKVPTATQSCEKIDAKTVNKDNDKPNKMETTQKDVASTEKSNVDSIKTDEKTIDLSKTAKVDSGVKKDPTSTQSCENTSQKIDVSKSAEKQDEPTKENVAGVPIIIENFTEEPPPAASTDATSKDPQLKTSRSVPDFAKSSMSDLLSSLPSARMSERALSQEPNKDATPKSRLWSPSLHKREFLKGFGDKQKSISTVVQIEEAAEEAGQSAASEASQSEKSHIGDKTETKQNQDLKVEPFTRATETKESAQILLTNSENTQPRQDGKESNASTSVLSKDIKTSSLFTTIPEKLMPQTENSIAKSTTGTIQVKEDSKETTKSQTIMPEQSKTKEKTAEEAISKEELVKTSASEEGLNRTMSVESVERNQGKALTSPSISDAKSPQLSQNQDAIVKSSGGETKDKNTSLSQSFVSVEQPKSELKQPINQAEQEKYSDERVNTSVKPLQTEKSNVVGGITKGADGAKKTQQLGSTEKSIVTPAEVESITSSSKSPDKTSSALPSYKTEQAGTVSFSIGETKHKCPINTEDVPQFEPHSNTSSPASYATALEFMSSEDSDMFSPTRADPQHLFKSGNTESSLSDMSDFETPNSEISMSPMPFAVNLDDTLEDNVSIAETVIDVDNGVTTQIEEALSKEEPQKETPKEHLSPEIRTENLDAANAKSESKYVSRGNLANQDTVKISEDEKAGEKIPGTAKSETGDASNTPVNITTKESPVGPATSQTKTRTVSSRFLTEPSITSMNTQASAVTPRVTEEVTIVKKTAEIEKEAKETDDLNLAASEADAKPMATNINTDKSHVDTQVTLEAKMVDQTSNSENKGAPPLQNAAKEDKGEAETEVSSSARTCSPKQEAKTEDKTSKGTTESIKKGDKDGQVDVSKETEVSSQATSENTNVLDKEATTVKEISTKGQSEQTSKDTNVNTKDSEPSPKEQAKQTSTSEPATVTETAPPNAQPKQQSKPPQSRYLSSTANVISSSNLRDDTKILLEQISAQSQSRNEQTTAKEAPVTDDEKEDEADKNAKRKKENELRSSLGQQKSNQEREKVLERIQTMRKDRKVYSRFEL